MSTLPHFNINNYSIIPPGYECNDSGNIVRKRVLKIKEWIKERNDTFFIRFKPSIPATRIYHKMTITKTGAIFTEDMIKNT